MLDKKSSASKLSAASRAIANLEDALQSELLQQQQRQQQQTLPKVEDPKAMEVEGGNRRDNVAAGDSTTLPTSAPPATPNATSIQAPPCQLDITDDTVEQLCLAAYLLSPASSGLYDELLAMVKMGLLDISPSSGIPLLAPDWASKVDYVVLEDMDAAWGTSGDPEGRHGIHFELRDALEEEWVKQSNGWALASDPDDIIFDLDELEEWREFFHGQLEEKAQISEGIGRFGL